MQATKVVLRIEAFILKAVRTRALRHQQFLKTSLIFAVYTARSLIPDWYHQDFPPWLCPALQRGRFYLQPSRL